MDVQQIAEPAMRAAVAESLEVVTAGMKEEFKCPAVSIDGHIESDDELYFYSGGPAIPQSKAKCAPKMPPTNEEEPKVEDVVPAAVAGNDVHAADEEIPDAWNFVDFEQGQQSECDAVATLDDDSEAVAASSAAVAEAMPAKAPPQRRQRSSKPSCKPPSPPRARTPLRLRSASRQKAIQRSRSRRRRSRSRSPSPEHRQPRRRSPWRSNGHRSPPAVAAQEDVQVGTPAVGNNDSSKSAMVLEPSTLPSCVGVRNGMLATWTVAFNAIESDVLDKLRESPFDCIIVQSTPKGMNGELTEGLKAAVADTKLWDPINCSFPTSACSLARCKGVYEVMPNTFAVINRKKVDTVSFVEYGLARSPQSRNSKQASSEPAGAGRSKTTWGKAQLGRVTMSFKTDKQRMPAIRVGVVYRQGDLVRSTLIGQGGDRGGARQIIPGDVKII